ncbi:MAG TPA: FtsW/RodA/SpoVE family cell cycle protein, partial [Mycobacterium sp.]|nr:FtsW/RodA/SpoVE family cell cycle protein [Mycobacterium sp.]
MGNSLTRLLRRGKGKIETSTEQGEVEEPGAASSTDAATTDAATSEIKASAGAKSQATAQDRGPRTRFGAWLGRPMTSFHLIIAVAALLTTLGLIMVLSASGVRSYGADGSAWVIFGKQVLWTIIGLIGAYVSMRMSVRFLR